MWIPGQAEGEVGITSDGGCIGSADLNRNFRIFSPIVRESSELGQVGLKLRMDLKLERYV